MLWAASQLKSLDVYYRGVSAVCFHTPSPLQQHEVMSTLPPWKAGTDRAAHTQTQGGGEEQYHANVTEVEQMYAVNSCCLSHSPILVSD